MATEKVSGSSEPRGGLTDSTRSKGGKASARRQIREAVEVYDPELMGSMWAFWGAGLTFKTVADFMNVLGHRTRTGALWRASTVQRVLERDATHKRRHKRPRDRWRGGWDKLPKDAYAPGLVKSHRCRPASSGEGSTSSNG
jgi:hypothetical protein